MSWTTFAKDGRRAGSRRQHVRMTSANIGVHFWLTMGISGRMFSSGCNVSEGATAISMQRTEHKVSHCVVVGQRPWQAALGENLDTADGKCVDVNLLRQFALACHQLRRLPPECTVGGGCPTQAIHLRLDLTLAKVRYHTVPAIVHEHIGALSQCMRHVIEAINGRLTLRSPCKTPLPWR